MRPARLLLGLWLGACTSAPAHEPPVGAPPPQQVLAAAAIPLPIVRPPAVVRVLVGGDVIPHRPQLLEPASISAALAPLGPLFRSADATIVNYETATGKLAAPSPRERMSLVASPAWMRAIASANVTALTLANNHACDLGARGLSASIAEARALDVPALGTDPWNALPIASRGGKRVCALAWTTFVNDKRAGCSNGKALAIARPTRDGRARVASAIASALAEGCDAVIAIAHGGDEYAPQTDAMMAMARSAADAGAVAVVLHHPHVVSPLVAYRTKDGRHVPIFASVGNLVSNQGESWTPAYPATQPDTHVVYMNGWTRVGMLADLDIDLDAKPAAATFGYHLVFLESDHVLDKSNPHPRIAARMLDRIGDHAVIDKLSRDRRGPRESPRAIFEDACWIEDGGRPSCN